MAIKKNQGESFLILVASFFDEKKVHSKASHIMWTFYYVMANRFQLVYGSPLVFHCQTKTQMALTLSAWLNSLHRISDDFSLSSNILCHTTAVKLHKLSHPIVIDKSLISQSLLEVEWSILCSICSNGKGVVWNLALS